MDFVYLKVVLLLNSWLFARGAPLAMLQHATSSQSIVFHQTQPTSPVPIAGPSSADQYSRNQQGVRKRKQPKYEYKYEVSDHQTGDRKTHWESREGDSVRGAYTLYEPDGALRTVEYTADALHGFNAVVKRDESTKNQHRRPVDSYSLGTNSVHDGYDASPTQNRFSTESFTNSNERPRYSGSSGSFGPAVGYSINHIVGLKKQEPISPY